MALERIMIKLGMHSQIEITKFEIVIDFINDVITSVEKQQMFIGCVSGPKPIENIEWMYIHMLNKTNKKLSGRGNRH